MSVSVGAMGLVELYDFLIANGTYASVADAMSALNIVIVEDVGAAGTALAVTGGPGQLVVGTVGETALEVAAQGQLAATGSNVTTAGIGLLQGETTTSAAALLGMDIGVVGAACAPLLGVSLGIGLYENNPELWTKISEKLLPFCYPGTTKIPTWGEIVNDAWQASVPKKILDALKELFEEEGIPIAGQTADSGYTDGPAGVINYFDHMYGTPTLSDQNAQFFEYTANGGHIYKTGTNNFVLVSLGPCSYHYKSWKRNGDVVQDSTRDANLQHHGIYGDYYVTGTFSPVTLRTIWSPSLSDATTTSIADILKNLTQGTDHPGTTGEYQEGTAEWTGNTPTEIPQSTPSVIGIDSITGQAITQPMVPIAPPYPIIIVPEPIETEPEPELIPFPWPEPTTPGHTEPWPETMPWPLPQEEPSWWPSELPYPYQYPVPQPTIDPDTSPDPDVITDPAEQISPYIMPTPIPYIVPTPESPIVTDPDLDPTKPRKPVITATPDPPINVSDPPPSGISPWPDMPGTSLAFSQGGGLVTVYHPTAAELYSFEQWLWVTYADSTIDKIFNNPFDGVITLFELYCTPTDVGDSTIKSGFLDSNIHSKVISRYTEIDCGTLGIPEYYGNYLDYSPYSKAHVYLPFIGIVELNVDDIVGHAVNITYRIDEYNGSCIAMITVAKVTEVNGEDIEYSNTMYQFSGNCAVELPLAGGSQAAIKAGMMQANAYQNASNISAGASLIGGIGSLILGSIGGAISGIGQAASNYAYGQANALSNMLSGKSTVQKSGTFGSSHGALGIKTPFITITRPKQIQVPNYNELYGYPAHKMVYIGDCTGFLRCREVHVISPTATDEEKTLIENLLKTGVYVNE